MKNIIITIFLILILSSCFGTSKELGVKAGDTSGKESFSLENNKNYQEAKKRLEAKQTIAKQLKEIKELEEKRRREKEIQDKIKIAVKKEINETKALEKAKKNCEEIGFKAGTEKFGLCVLDMLE